MTNGNGAVAACSEQNVLFFRLGPHCAHGLGDGIGQRRFLHVKGEGARLQPGHFDQRLHEKIQLVDLLLHGVQKLGLFLRGQLVLLQNTGKHFDIGDGSLDLMGDIADQSLDGLLVPQALALALAHNVEILHQLALYLGGETVLIRLIALRLAA